MQSLKFFILLAFICISFITNAKEFSNEFIQFDLPNGWECSLDETEWICLSQDQSNQKVAIIVFTAVNVSDQDKLGEYKNYLSQPIKLNSADGSLLKSKPKYVIYKFIKEKEWVDSLHLNSEYVGFYTRYLLTINSKMAIGVTISVKEDAYESYEELVEKIVESFVIFSPKDSNSIFKKKQIENLDIPNNNIEIDSGLDNGLDNGLDSSKILYSNKPKITNKSQDYSYYIIGIFILGIVLFLLKKKK